ncbi:MAG: polyprenyl synthetase family protein [Nitrospinota bacterium]|nr:polyprenyl synthetase family protein [Nitrospinota bacterium]
MNSHFKEIRKEIESELKRIFNVRQDIPKKLFESMSYSVFAGGKRLRPCLVVAGTEAVGGNRKNALPTAAALELIHTYTLIHDDLPAMDNDDLRRGLPTNHIKFGEATAILAGDALLTLAFEILSESPPNGSGIPSDIMIRIIGIVGQAVGAQGTVGGQEVDIESEGKKGDMETLEYIHTRKTGAMIIAAVKAGGLIGNANDRELASLAKYGENIGHAFQIVDDILDVTGNTEELGKSAGSDDARSKMTYPSLLGLDRSRELASEKIINAIAALKDLKGNIKPLEELALFIGSRTH